MGNLEKQVDPHRDTAKVLKARDYLKHPQEEQQERGQPRDISEIPPALFPSTSSA